jgi:hypothetical protein
MKYGRLIVLVLVAFMAVAGLWFTLSENAKDWRMMKQATEKMNEATERSYGKD